MLKHTPLRRRITKNKRKHTEDHGSDQDQDKRQIKIDQGQRETRLEAGHSMSPSFILKPIFIENPETQHPAKSTIIDHLTIIASAISSGKCRGSFKQKKIRFRTRISQIRFIRSSIISWHLSQLFSQRNIPARSSFVCNSN